MERVNLTRSYLETLSSADLKDLADEYGIDIPENLSRRFVIAELLEASAENPVEDSFTLCEEAEPDTKISKNLYQSLTSVPDLPFSYNENKINAVLRNPAWCYVYWDIKKSDYANLTNDMFFVGFGIRISCFKDPENAALCEKFDISVEQNDRDQYVFLPVQALAVKFTLIAEFEDNRFVELAHSEPLLIPFQRPYIGSLFLQRDFAPIFTLSGLPELIRYQYNEHRQSFSMDM